MTGYDRVDCRLHNNTAYSTGVNTRDDRAVLVQYIISLEPYQQEWLKAKIVDFVVRYKFRA